MNSYFGLLDKACLFEVLVRIHYVDLMNLLKVRLYLTNMTATNYFWKKWKAYNIRTIFRKSSTKRLVIEKDRLNRRHGTAFIYHYDLLFEQSEFVNGLRNGITIRYHDNGLVQSRVTFIDGKMQGLRYQYEDDGMLIETKNFERGVRKGITTLYDDDGSIELTERGNAWWPNGQRKRICTYKGRCIEGKCQHWSEDGVKWPDVYYKRGLIVNN
jgi:antitoxin component YwqK of YwqJK toxin-antitoxin module